MDKELVRLCLPSPSILRGYWKLDSFRASAFFDSKYASVVKFHTQIKILILILLKISHCLSDYEMKKDILL